MRFRRFHPPPTEDNKQPAPIANNKPGVRKVPGYVRPASRHSRQWLRASLRHSLLEKDRGRAALLLVPRWEFIDTRGIHCPGLAKLAHFFLLPLPPNM